MINWIRLQNFLSHRDSYFELPDGLTAIVGPNGSGKSSIITAIGLALFDYSSYNGQALIRHGATVAQVELNFTSRFDQAAYTITRLIGGSVYTVQNSAGSLVASGSQGKLSVPNFVKTHLGLNQEINLSALARDTVITWQEQIVTPFMQRASIRKPMFDQLLGIDEYQVAWENLREPLTQIDKQVARLSESATRLQARVEQLGLAKQEFDQLQLKINQAEQEAVRLEQELVELRQKLAAQDNRAMQETAIAQQARRVNNLELELARMQSQVEVAQVKLEKVEAKCAFGPKASIQQHQKHIEDLKQISTAVCPVCARPLSEPERGRLIDLARQQITRLERQLDFVPADPQVQGAKLSVGESMEQVRQIQGKLVTEKKYMQQLCDALDAPGNLPELRRQEAQLSQAAGVERGKIESMRHEAGRLEARINLLKKDQAELQEIQARLGQVRSAQDRLIQIREVIRQAGPLVAEQIVQAVSQNASVLFSELMAEHEPAELIWQADYGITTISSGIELDLSRHHVNGGKRTMAAIAVRLALADFLGNVGLVIFDEPTTSLDHEARYRLAESIGRIAPRFQQIVVISHSDEFAPLAGRTIKLGGSS